VDSVSPVPRNEDGVPRARTLLPSPPGGASRQERWPGANEEKAEKLLVRSLKRQAGARGLELRHSAYGYALIDSARKQVEDRNDMTLKQVESWLKRG
jgi:hypothetical protein